MVGNLSSGRQAEVLYVLIGSRGAALFKTNLSTFVSWPPRHRMWPLRKILTQQPTCKRDNGVRRAMSGIATGCQSVDVRLTTEKR